MVAVQIATNLIAIVSGISLLRSIIKFSLIYALVFFNFFLVAQQKYTLLDQKMMSYILIYGLGLVFHFVLHLL